MLSPVSEYLPLKSGTVRGSLINLASSPSGARHIDTKNFTGGYFFESEDKSYGVFKKTAGKVQFNRQIKNSLNSNFMNEWKSEVLGANLKFSRNVVRTGSSGSQNVQDTRRVSFDYKTKNNVSFSFVTDTVGSRTISASPSKTTNKKQQWALTMPIKKDKAKLTLLHSLTANRNHVNGDVAKALLSEIKLDVPFSKKLELNLGYQFTGNSTLPGTGAAGQNTRKNIKTIGVSYLLAQDTKISLLLNNISTSNYAASFSANNTRKLDLKLDHAFSERARFKSSFSANNDGISGRTRMRNDSFSYDHKNLSYFPGTTTFESRRQIQSGLNSTENDTVTISTPLSYLENRLTLNLQHTNNAQKALTTHQDSSSTNNTVSADYKITKSFSAGANLNKVKNSTYLLDVMTGNTSNRTNTYKTELTVRNLFGDHVGALENFKYSYSLSTANTENIVPDTIGNANRVRKHSFLFSFKEDIWNGKYSISRALSSNSSGQTQRSLIHKAEWTFDNLYGCQFTTTYTGAFMKTGVQSSGVFKLTRKLAEKKSLYASYEFLRNKDRLTPANNAIGRYFELGLEASF